MIGRSLAAALLVLAPSLCGCAYLTDRVRDFADIFHGELHLGPGIHANAQVTRFCNAGLGFRATEAYGFIGRRAGKWEDRRFDCSAPVPYFGPRIGLGWSSRNRLSGTVEQSPADVFSRWAGDYHPLSDSNRRPGDIGGGVCALFIGISFHVSLFELADFISGLACIDIMQDDDAGLLRRFDSADADKRLAAYEKFFSRRGDCAGAWEPTEYERALLDDAGFAYPDKFALKLLNDPDDRIAKLGAQMLPVPAQFDFISLAARLGESTPARFSAEAFGEMDALPRDENSEKKINRAIELLGAGLPPEHFVSRKNPGAVPGLISAIKGKKTREEISTYLAALNKQKDARAVPALVSLLGEVEDNAKPDVLYSLLRHESYGDGDLGAFRGFIKERHNTDTASWYAIEIIVRGGDGAMLGRVQKAAETRGQWLPVQVAKLILSRRSFAVEDLLPYRDR
ncbi:MAG: hypothetical protein E3J72_06740 [Planctomycetota bacterium]|nr:MAG: hypothetical protein E3J72_06740 [Planctomycetota bacterium]